MGLFDIDLVASWLRIFWFSFRHEGFLLRFFSALLPLDNYKFKSNQKSGASGIEVKQLLETAKICGANAGGPFFAAKFLCCFGLSSVC